MPTVYIVENQNRLGVSISYIFTLRHHYGQDYCKGLQNSDGQWLASVWSALMVYILWLGGEAWCVSHTITNRVAPRTQFGVTRRTIGSPKPKKRFCELFTAI